MKEYLIVIGIILISQIGLVILYILQKRNLRR
jgi:hypothetical protein